MHGGVITGPGVPNVLIGGMPASVVGDMHVCPMVTPATPPVPHVGGPVVSPGAPTVLIGGRPAATIGSMCTCVGPPDSVIMGAMTVILGAAGSGAGSAGSGGGGGAAGANASAAAASFDNFESVTKEEHWIEFQFVDSAGNPISGVPYKLTDPDGNVSESVLRLDGKIRRDDVSEGEGEVVLMSVHNAQWSKEEATVGDAVELSADVEGFENGTPALFQVYRRDLKGPDIAVADVPAKVRGEKIEAEWSYTYPDDEETTQSILEGSIPYAHPEFYFVALVGSCIAKSGLLTASASIKIELLGEAGEGVPNKDYMLFSASGEVRQGSLDSAGRAEESNLPPGKIAVRFTERPPEEKIETQEKAQQSPIEAQATRAKPAPPKTISVATDGESVATTERSSAKTCALLDISATTTDGRNISGGEVLDVVPAVGGKVVTVAAKTEGKLCSDHPQWQFTGFRTGDAHGMRASLSLDYLEELHPALGILCRTLPKDYVVTATACDGTRQRLTVRVYPGNEIVIKFDLDRALDVFQQVKDMAETALNQVGPLRLEWMLPKRGAPASFRNQWSEDIKDNHAYWTWTFELELDPIFGVTGRVEIGTSTALPRLVREYAGAALYVEVGGNVSLKGNGSRTNDRGQYTIDLVAVGEIGIQVGGEAQLFSKDCLRLDVNGSSALSTKAHDHFYRENEGIGSQIDVDWEGVKAQFSMKLLYGIVSFDECWQIVEGKPILKDYSVYLWLF